MDDAKHLYNVILQTAQHFLHNSKRFTVEVLSEENPTYDAVASFADQLAKIILAIADDFDPLLCQKAQEYCDLMKKMGLAINKKDQTELSQLTEQLEKRPFL